MDYGDGDSKAEGEKGGEKKVERGINQSHCKAEGRGKKWQQIKNILPKNYEKREHALKAKKKKGGFVGGALHRTADGELWRVRRPFLCREGSVWLLLVSYDTTEPF